jgi:hypothetical protein
MGQENIIKLTGSDHKPDWTFYVAWVSVTSLCMPAAFLISLFFDRIAVSLVGDYIVVNGVRHITEDYLALYFLVPITALLTGAAQYMLLRRYLPRMGWWVLATLGGWLLGMILISLSVRLGRMEPFNITLTFLLVGLSIGFGQWLVLVRRLPGSGWWIVANLLGWGLLILFNQGNAIEQFGILALGFFPGCTTAVTLALLMKQTQLPEAQVT